MANLEESSEEEQQHEQGDLENEREWFDLEDRGMCPPCSLEKGEDVPLPESEVCPVCRYGDRSQPINIRQAEVTRTFIGHGVVLYALFVPEHVSPLGLVWGTEFTVDGKNFFELAHSYVIPDPRRQGVRTKIDEHIFSNHDFVLTGDGSAEGGLGYLKASGYKQDETTHMWVRAHVG